MKKRLNSQKGYNSLTALVQPEKWFLFLSPEFISINKIDEPTQLEQINNWAVGNSKINVAGDYPDLFGQQPGLRCSGFAPMDKSCALGHESMLFFHYN